MVEIKNLKVNPDGMPQFPMRVLEKKQAVALLDFEQFDCQKNIQMFRETQERGSYCVTYQKSYNHLLDLLDNKQLLKDRWEREAGVLHILPDLEEPSGGIKAQANESI